MTEPSPTLERPSARPFWDRLEEGGESIALVSRAGEVWTYRRLAQTVAQLRDTLTSERKQLILLAPANNVGGVAWMLAALGAGHALISLSPTRPTEVVRRAVEMFEPDVVISVGPSIEGPSSGVGFGYSVIRRKVSKPTKCHPSLALLLPTSGTAGSPKFVRLTASNLDANAHQIACALAIQPDERAIASLPLTYSFGLSVVTSHLWAGASVLLEDRSVMTPGFWRSVRDRQATTLAGVPFTYQIMRECEIGPADAPTLRKLIQAGGALPVDNARWLADTFGRAGAAIFLMYGQTEATARMTVLPPDLLNAKPGSVGRAVPGGNIELASDGQIVYHGPNVMMGYASGRLDLARGDDLRGVLRTGDLGEIDADECLTILGRKSRICKIAGLRINLEEVEGRLSSVGAVAAVSDDVSIRLFYEDSAVADALRVAARGLSLALGIPPSFIELRHISPLPRTESGKVESSSLLRLE
jgi:long-chain acyl-CoA synthetase